MQYARIEWCCRKHTPRPNFFTACNCGNKRCPHADDCAYACTRSNQPDQEPVLIAELHAALDEVFTRLCQMGGEP